MLIKYETLDFGNFGKFANTILNKSKSDIPPSFNGP